MPGQKQISFDLDGSDAVSSVLMEMLNTFPGLGTRSVKFSTLDDGAGIGFFPTSGAAIRSNKDYVDGRVHQECLYPFSIIYRLSPKTEDHKLKAQEFLDTFGRWLERQPVTINNTEHQLASYPALHSGNRVIKSISRTNPAHMNVAYQDGVQDWIISATLQYENDFYK